MLIFTIDSRGEFSNFPQFKEFYNGGVQLLSHIQLSCDPVDRRPPGSTVHVISQARIMEWVPFPFPGGSSQPRDRTVSCALAGRFLTTVLPGKPCNSVCIV